MRQGDIMQLAETILGKLFPPKLPRVESINMPAEDNLDCGVIRVYPKKYRDGIERVMTEGIN